MNTRRPSEACRSMAEHRARFDAILAELSAMPGGQPQDRAALARHLSTATFALARRLAEGAIPTTDIPRHVTFLMRTCG